ncbi:uncharacterized protein V6R79_002482 [Siganus canaliculatus]
MWSRLSVLVLCWALSGLDALEADKSADPSQETMQRTEAADLGKAGTDAPSTATAADSLRGVELPSSGGNPSVHPPTTEPLEDELDNQENIISQLLGDYDKVKTVSSGSDCVCRCIVRPIKRSDCSRIHDSDMASVSQHFYSVETVAKGTDCKKCVCMAPPSAVNPCEGEYRFKKLQEASKDDIKLATIIDLLEGSLYGLDLLKLNSVTNKLLSRVDNIEKAFAGNFTERVREKERLKEKAKEKEKKALQKKKKVNDLDRAGQKSGAAAFANKQKNYELKKNQQQDGLEHQQSARNKTATQKPIKEKPEPKQPIKDKPEPKQPIKDKPEPKQPIKEKPEPKQPIKDKPEPKQPIKDKPEPKQPIKDKPEPKQPIKDKNNVVIRGVTFYKAGDEEEEEDEKDKRKSSTSTSDGSVDLVISDQVPPTRTFPTKSPGPTATAITDMNFQNQSRRLSRPAPTQPPTAPPTTVQQTTTTTQAAPTTIKQTTELTTEMPTTTTTPKATTTKLTTTSQQTTTTIQPTLNVNQQTTSSSGTNKDPPTGPKTRLSWTESPVDQPKTTTKPAVCKDTVASISEPVQQNSYGFSDGAWMKDARGHGKVVYLTNGHYGNNLLEFRDTDTFKSGQPSNSYKLPYSFTGTGHVVFNGAFYYNRAFSRDIIRYDLRRRYVAAWTTLHDALLEEQAHGTQTEVEFAVDESGLWLLYPALDTEGFHQEVILLNHLNARDLQPMQSFRTGLRRGHYGNSFLVCGVLYAVNSMEHHYANVTYAFDTHTLTHTVPSLPFTNMHAHTSQVAYSPLDKKLYAWDDGHQMTYDVVFAY